MKDLIYHSKKKISIAENWEEISGKQLIAIAGLLHLGIDDAAIASDKALFILSGKKLLPFLLISLDIRMRCYEHVQWVFQEQNITQQLIPVYKKLHGPESEFGNLQAAEFHHTEIAYQRLVHEDEIDALNELVAILYREPRKNYDLKRNSDGDTRIPFSFGDIEYHKKIVKRWPIQVQQAILMWYDACREQLRTFYPQAFEGIGDSNSNYYDGLFGLIRNIAAGNKYGDFEKVEHMYVHNMFREIVECIEEDKKLQSQLNATK